MMSLRGMARVALVMVGAIALAAAVSLAAGPGSPALLAAGAVASVLLAPTLPVAVLRRVNPPTTAMMWRARRQAAVGSPGGRAPVHEWVDLDRVSRPMRLAAITAEDACFKDHSGFDWESIRDARAYNRAHPHKRGASTITQQVAKNLFLWPRKSYVRKAIEAYLTVLIEALWPKRRILEVYLNVAQFGEDIFGVEAAARRFFNKPASQITDIEAALLAAALPNPLRYDVGRPSHQLRFRQAWVRAAARRLGAAYLDRL
jgi:monofunctional biosynthetic peptidoglycan transglycosylase